MATTEKIIETKGLTKEYPFGETTIKAINGIDITIEKGEYVTIVGPSGSGKTTFLNLIGTIDQPTTGEIFFKGERLSQMTNRELRELRRTNIGFVFQAFNLLEILTTAENIALPMIIKGVPTREREERVQELLEIIGLPDRGNHFPLELSGGQRQRVAIARALANYPDVLLADEPSGQLDSNTSREIMDYLFKINKEEEVTLIVVTHDERLTSKAERPLTMMDGKLYEGILESFLDAKALQASGL